MPVSLTTLSGPIYMPNGATPVGGKVSFELSSWDREEGEALIVSGPTYSSIDENGQFSVELFTTTEGVNTVNYRMYVLWEDSELSQSYVNDVYVSSPVPHYTKKYIGSFALAGVGPFQVSDLNIVSELGLNSFDVLLECQAYSLAAGVSANAAAVSANTAASIASAVAGDVDQIITFTGAQMQTVSQFSTLEQFEGYSTVFDYWHLGDTVRAGDLELQKRSVSNGVVVANAWVVHGSADKLLDGYLPKASGAVKHHHISDMPAFTLLANDLAVSAAPFPVTYEKALSTMGVHSYGDTQSGGISTPLSSTVPNAPNGLRCGRGTSSAGETTVTFSNKFAPCIPNVMISPRIVGSGAASLFAMLTEEPTVTGFKFIIRNAAGTAVAAPYHFIAMGQDD